nr:MAG: DUF1364 domain-containing protein [Pseudomonadota bacterium]
MTDLRKLARGQPCQLRLPGICNHDNETTVLAHVKAGWCGSSKPPDICGIWMCSNCHDVFDGRRYSEYSRTELDAEALRALTQQLVWYVRHGVVRW